MLGVDDSFIREHAFSRLAELLGVDYDVLYSLWLDGGEARPYWVLPLDSYNQPSGQVQKEMMTPAQAKELKKTNPYVYDNEYQALLRAQD